MENRDPSSESTVPKPLQPDIVLQFDKFESFLDEYASYVSLGGIFLATPEVRPVGEVIDFRIELSDGYRLVEGVGHVAWLRPGDGGPGRPPGMAVRLHALKGRDLVLKILEEQVKSGGAPFEVEDPPSDAVTAAGAIPRPPAAAGERPSRPLQFDAPWGKELPAVPDEILDDTGSLGGRSSPQAAADGGGEAPRGQPEAELLPDVESVFDELDEAADGEPPDPPTSEAAFRLAAEAAHELDALPELSAEPAADVDEDEDLALDLDAGAGFVEPGAGVEIAASEDEDPPERMAAAAAEQAAEASPRTPSFLAPPEPLPPDPRPPVLEPAASHGAMLDYEHELSVEGASRGRGAFGARTWVAGLAVVSVLAAGGWWLWGRSPEPAAAARVPPAEPLHGGDLGAPTAPPSAEMAAPPDSAAVERPDLASAEPVAEPGSVRAPAPSPPARPAAGAATAVRDISWQRDAGGTWVTIALDGAPDRRRVRLDRLAWAADKEQVSLVGIELPYLPATLEVATPELLRIRTGLHGAGSAAELRLVFDLAPAAAGLGEPQLGGDRLRILVRRR